MTRVKHEAKKRVISLVKKGYSYSRAAREVGVSCSTVYRWCTSAGVKSRFKRGGPRKYDWEEIAEEYERTGKSIPTLAREHGASPKTIHTIVSRMGKSRGISEALVLLRGEWRRLHPTSRTKEGHLGTRIVAVPVSLLRELGFDRDDEIYGRWRIDGDQLVLELKRRGI